MITSCSTTPLEEIRKDNASSNPNNSDPSESSTGESQYKEDTNDNKSVQNINNKKYKKNNNEKKLLNKKVKRLNLKDLIFNLLIKSKKIIAIINLILLVIFSKNSNQIFHSIINILNLK